GRQPAAAADHHPAALPVLQPGRAAGVAVELGPAQRQRVGPDPDPRRVPERLLHVRPQQLHEAAAEVAERSREDGRRERLEAVLADHHAADVAGDRGAGHPGVHLDLQRLLLGGGAGAAGGGPTDHLVARQPRRRVLHRRQPDRRGVDVRRAADAARLLRAPALLHRRVDDRRRKGL
ncbi:MAG: ABC transporter, permease protein 2 (cluster 1, maltose/g3p/polyamine/iron), partial [uncultured Thermomicrobiales bacterium]